MMFDAQSLDVMLASRFYSKPARRNSVAGIDYAYIELDQCHIRYLAIDNGKPSIVIAADPPNVLETYETLARCLSEYFSPVIFEQPGFGYSYPKKGMQFTFMNMTRAVHDFILRLNIETCTLLIPCVTGYSSLYLANKNPALVRNVIMLQQGCLQTSRTWARKRDPRNILRRPYLGQIVLNLLKNKRLSKWYENVIHDPQTGSELHRSTLREFRQGACFCLASGIQYYLFDDIPEIAPIKQETIIIWGKDDRTHAGSDIGSSKALAPNHKFYAIANCGHSPELEYPSLFTSYVKELAK